MRAIKANGVRHEYGKGETKQEVLKDFALEMDEGDFLALMGPSGSGKSTFLHLAAGLLLPRSGTILVGESEVTAMSDSAATKFRRRHEGVVFQAFNLLENLTVEENIRLPEKLEGKTIAEAGRVKDLLKKLGLEALAGKKPGELSGGEQQRVAIARALYLKPEIVLADEPTGNLDAKASKTICELLKDLNETEKIAILLVTHDPQVAVAAKKVAFLKDGAIAAIYDTKGDAAEVSRLYLETYK